MRFAAAILASVAVAVAVAIAPASAGRVAGSRDLWATINVCDTDRQPDRIGIRGSMPGLGKRKAVLYMRFRVQFLSRSDGRWRDVTEGADTGYVPVGVSRRRVFEAGHTFRFRPPSDGGAHTLRGAVTFAWKVRGRVVKRVREFTEAGHRSKTADPPGFSAAICRIS